MRRWLVLGALLPVVGVWAAGGQSGPDKPLSILHILNIPDFTDFSLSPDGRRVAVTASGLGRENVFVISDPDQPGEPVPRSEGRERSRQPDWAPDGKSLTFISDREGTGHVFVGSPGSPEATPITRHQGEDSHPRWSPDGKRIVFLSERLGSETGWDVWVVSSQGGQPSRLTQDPMDEQDPRWSPDGRSIAYTYRAGHHVNRRIAVVAAEPADSSAPRPILPDEWEGDSHSARWSPDGKGLAFVSDHDGKKTIYTVSTEGGKPERLIDSALEETEPAWSPDGKEIAHISNREGTLLLSVTNVSTRETRPLTLGAGVRSRPQWGPDGEAVACFYEGPAYPKNVWRFGKNGERTRLTESLPEDLDVRQLIRPELVRYESFDGRTITGLLYMPPEASADRPASLIVHPHGGPTSQWKNGWHPFVQFLAQQGFAVFAPNVRGSSGFGLEFENLNDKDWGRGDLEDLVVGVRLLIKRPELRDDRVGIWGVSYGGFLTLAAIGQYPELFSCAIEAVGMPDLEKLYRETNTEGRTYLDRELGPLRGNLQLYRDLSPIRNVDRIKTPLLSFHGEDYPLVPISTKIDFMRSLNKPGYPLLDYVFKGELARGTYRFDIYPSASRMYMEKILEFIQIYL